MNIMRVMNKVSAIGKYLLLIVLAINLISFTYAASATGATLTTALKSLCGTAKTFLGATAMILVVLAGATYAVGQVMGAETRARAAVWATAMLTGAVIGIVIYVIMPPLISLMMGYTTSADPCTTISISGGV